MATEGHQAGDDSGFAEAHVAYEDGPRALAWFAGPQVILELLEQPIAAHEHWVSGDAGNLEQQWLEHDVSGLVRSKASCKTHNTGLITCKQIRQSGVACYMYVGYLSLGFIFMSYASPPLTRP